MYFWKISGSKLKAEFVFPSTTCRQKVHCWTLVFVMLFFINVILIQRFSIIFDHWCSPGGLRRRALSPKTLKKLQHNFIFRSSALKNPTVREGTICKTNQRFLSFLKHIRCLFSGLLSRLHLLLPFGVSCTSPNALFSTLWGHLSELTPKNICFACFPFSVVFVLEILIFRLAHRFL